MKNNVTLQGFTQQINSIAYDRERLVNGARKVTLFTTVQNEGLTSDVGVATGGKVLADTNMTQKGRVEVIKPMTVNGFYLRLEAGKSATSFVPAGYAGYTQDDSEATFTGANDIAALLASINVVVKVGTDTEYLVGNISNFPPPNGATAAFGGSGTFASAQQAGQVYEFIEPITWTNDLPISVELQMSNGLIIPSGNIARVTGCFTGTYSKAVQ